MTNEETLRMFSQIMHPGVYPLFNSLMLQGISQVIVTVRFYFNFLFCFVLYMSILFFLWFKEYLWDF